MNTQTHKRTQEAMHEMPLSWLLFERVRYLTDSTLGVVCLRLLCDLSADKMQKEIEGVKMPALWPEGARLSLVHSSLSFFALSLFSLMWPSLFLSSSSVFRGASVRHSVGIRMHELFDNQSLL